MPRLRILIATAASLAVVVPAAPAAAKTVRGTVVEKTSKRSFVVAQASGKLVQVRGARAPRVGRTVRATGARRGAVLRASRVRLTGSRRHVRLAGRVARVSRRHFVVKGGTPDVSVRRSGKRVSRDDEVTVDATIDDGQVEADEVETEDLEVEGRITAIDTAARTLTIAGEEGCRHDDDQGDDDAQGDDDDQGEDDESTTTVVHVPESIDMAQFSVGDEVELNVTRADDGTVTLVSVDDHGDDEAEDHGDDDGGHHQGGDDGGDHEDHSGSNSGDGSGSDD